MNEKEVCVSCGVKTDVAQNTPIDIRHFYVEGAGQLCRECWNVVYKEKNETQL